MSNSFVENNPIKTEHTKLEFVDKIKCLIKTPNIDGNLMTEITKKDLRGVYLE